jgi:NAD(P)-dependent dehydrogenase (short-subunit alcohol dehydrogenase family)
MLTAVLAKEEPLVRAVAVRPGVVATDMQQTIRAHGAGTMEAAQHAHFVSLHRDDALLAPALPAGAIATLALACPAAWSGTFVSWNDERVAALTTATASKD